MEKKSNWVLAPPLPPGKKAAETGGNYFYQSVQSGHLVWQVSVLVTITMRFWEVSGILGSIVFVAEAILDFSNNKTPK